MPASALLAATARPRHPRQRQRRRHGLPQPERCECVPRAACLLLTTRHSPHQGHPGLQGALPHHRMTARAEPATDCRRRASPHQARVSCNTRILQGGRLVCTVQQCGQAALHPHARVRSALRPDGMPQARGKSTLRRQTPRIPRNHVVAGRKSGGADPGYKLAQKVRRTRVGRSARSDSFAAVI